MTTKIKQDHMTPVNSWDEVPEFTSEEQEHEFWSRHGLGEALLEQMSPRTLEEEMASMVRIVGNSFNGDFDLTLDLPEHIVKELAACADDPSRLALLEFILTNQMSLMRGFLLMAEHQSDVRSLEEGTFSQGEGVQAQTNFEGKSERGLLDYQAAHTAATTEIVLTMTSITNRMNESTKLLSEENAKLERDGQNPTVFAMSIKKVAAFMHGYADGVKKDARKLKENTAAMYESFLGLMDATNRQPGGEVGISELKGVITDLQTAVKGLKPSLEEHKEAVSGSYGIRDDLTKAAERVNAAFQQLSDAVDELIAFTEMALEKID